MFTQVLIVRLVVAVVVAAVVLRLFRHPVRRILESLVGAEFVSPWIRYIQFAAYVLAVSRGVKLFQLDVLTRTDGGEYRWARVLTAERWVYELFEAALHVAQGLAFGFLAFFLVALTLVALGRILAQRRDRDTPAR